MTLRQLKVLLLILDQFYGYKVNGKYKTEDWLSNGWFTRRVGMAKCKATEKRKPREKGAGLDAQGISRVISSLKKKNIINIELRFKNATSERKYRYVSLNDPSQWQIKVINPGKEYQAMVDTEQQTMVDINHHATVDKDYHTTEVSSTELPSTDLLNTESVKPALDSSKDEDKTGLPTLTEFIAEKERILAEIQVKLDNGYYDDKTEIELPLDEIITSWCTGIIETQGDCNLNRDLNKLYYGASNCTPVALSKAKEQIKKNGIETKNKIELFNHFIIHFKDTILQKMKEEDRKALEFENLSDRDKIFYAWNSWKTTLHHKRLTPEIELAIDNILKDYTWIEVCQRFRNYANNKEEFWVKFKAGSGAWGIIKALQHIEDGVFNSEMKGEQWQYPR